ncbi:3-keto-steroid reductase [Aspergillus neoniger CBS 115656]|uniref:3beta-hydroxysteroid 3-dehydrogenase n=1 Tax=Aspergillus neoniger (strain CBS 115656) TaxID=1448310 RepID=A0A318YKL6_ASPNB|nr:3-ketosteroid reductase [Aspergillus neoniger CBS 115656]PYH34654.1 3-ketosteroid reductase [Aspergillus neoniger CBS 115656]
MAEPPQHDLDNQFYVLVTGANSGLGLAICARLITTFLTTHPPTTHLTIIFTTRSAKKASSTLHHLQTLLPPISSPTSSSRITLHPETVDLSSLPSVRALSTRLTQALPKLDSIVLNAGIGGWTGIDWPRAIWGTLTDLVHNVSWFAHKIAPVGMITPPQTTQPEEPRLGSVFAANVFGHYMLSHGVMGLLRKSTQPGRVIWVSSIEATVNHFNVEDIQGLRSKVPYESSKTLTDILALTAETPSTRKWVEGFYTPHKGGDDVDEKGGEREGKEPRMYLSHPGVCGTGILPLALPLFWCMIASFYIARLLGSPWHTLSTYAGACAPTWLAISRQEELDAAEEVYRAHGGGKVKWGSSCDRLGRDTAVSTEVDGWGHGGVVGEAVVMEDRLRRRKRGARDLTAEEKVEFEELGRKCWQGMEELRVQWEEILEREEAAAA